MNDTLILGLLMRPDSSSPLAVAIKARRVAALLREQAPRQRAQTISNLYGHLLHCSRPSSGPAPIARMMQALVDSMPFATPRNRNLLAGDLEFLSTRNGVTPVLGVRATEVGILNAESPEVRQRCVRSWRDHVGRLAEQTPMAAAEEALRLHGKALAAGLDAVATAAKQTHGRVKPNPVSSMLVRHILRPMGYCRRPRSGLVTQ